MQNYLGHEQSPFLSIVHWTNIIVCKNEIQSHSRSGNGLVLFFSHFLPVYFCEVPMQIPFTYTLENWEESTYCTLKVMTFVVFQACFTFRQSVGVIGGKPNHAYYFIGYYGNYFYFSVTTVFFSKWLEAVQRSGEELFAHSNIRLFYPSVESIS